MTDYAVSLNFFLNLPAHKSFMQVGTFEMRT